MFLVLFFYEQLADKSLVGARSFQPKEKKMFVVVLSGSRFFRSNHYLTVTPGVHIVQRSAKRATHLTRDQAEKIAANWSDPNGFTAAVQAA